MTCHQSVHPSNDLYLACMIKHQSQYQAANEFKRRLVDGGSFEQLFEHLSDVYFFAKDAYCRFVMTNKANLRLLGMDHPSELIGKSNQEVFPPVIASSIESDDQNLLRSAEPLLNRVELVVNEQGGISWFSTNKIPLFDHQGEVAGLMGTTIVLRDAEEAMHPYRDIAPALAYIQDHFCEVISIEALAQQCHLSASQFRRRFNHHFKTSPTHFIMRLRLQNATRLLTSTNHAISEIAHRCGFSDQSHFTKQFKSMMGISPRQYRQDQHS